MSIVADTVQFLDPPGARSGEGGATETDGEEAELAAVATDGSEEDLAF